MKPEWSKKYLWKQTKDQIAHAVWGFVSGTFPHLGVALAKARPELIMEPVAIIIGTVATGFSVIGWFLRESEQGKDGSHWWFDPWLDSIVFAFFLAVGFVGSMQLVR